MTNAANNHSSVSSGKRRKCRRLIPLICIIGLLRCACSAQESSTPPQNWTKAAVLPMDMHFGHVKLSHNTPEIIRQEVFDTNTIRLIAESSGLAESDLATVRVAEEPRSSWIKLYQIGKSERAFNVLEDQLGRYIEARDEGHTRAFVLAAITNRVDLSTISDPSLRALATGRDLIALSWLVKEASGATTNKAGVIASSTVSETVVNGRSVKTTNNHIPKMDEVCPWTSYTLTDGEIGWHYRVMFKADGSLDCVYAERCDAKEYDPQYQASVKEANTEVEAEMKKEGSYGRFGSVHRFWRLKQEKLKARGIEWRSPAELNPNIHYD